MSKADLSDFRYHINTTDGTPVIVIEDLDRGGMSVTNNMEAALHYVAEDAGLDLTQAKIVYRDSEGSYDGVQFMENETVRFYMPAAGRRITSEIDAVEAVRRGNLSG